MGIGLAARVFSGPGHGWSIIRTCSQPPVGNSAAIYVIGVLFICMYLRCGIDFTTRYREGVGMLAFSGLFMKASVRARMQPSQTQWCLFSVFSATRSSASANTPTCYVSTSGYIDKEAILYDLQGYHVWRSYTCGYHCSLSGLWDLAGWREISV